MAAGFPVSLRFGDSVVLQCLMPADFERLRTHDEEAQTSISHICIEFDYFLQSQQKIYSLICLELS